MLHLLPPLSKDNEPEPDFKGRIFAFALLKYSYIRQDLLRFVPRTDKNPPL